jgi:hypothetical protein
MSENFTLVSVTSSVLSYSTSMGLLSELVTATGLTSSGLCISYENLQQNKLLMATLKYWDIQ